MIAMRFALKYPQRVRALLLYDTGPGLQGPHRHWFDALYGSASNLVRTEGVGAWLKRMWPVLAQTFPPEGQLPAGVRRHLEGLERMSAELDREAADVFWQRYPVARMATGDLMPGVV